MSEPIRVLQIIGLSCGGGVEAVIMNYYRHIDKSKVQFDFVVHKNPLQSFSDEAKSMGAKVYEVTPYTQNIIKFTYEIYRIIKEGNYKIVHSNMNSLSGFPLLAAYFAGANVRILHNHTTDTKEEGLRTTIKRVLRPFAKAFANQCWACSKLAGEWMYGKEAVENSRVTVINNAIDLDKFSFSKDKRDQLRKELDLEDKFVIGHVGRFVKTKNHAFIIDVFVEVARRKNNAVLLLVGEGPLMDSVKTKINNIGIHQNVLFLGVRSDVADLYNVMDVFVFPSLYEGLGMVAVEAQVNGLPVVASTKVPLEARVNENIVFVDLGIGAKTWSEKIINFDNYELRNFKEKVSVLSFDVQVESKKLERIYECMGK